MRGTPEESRRAGDAIFDFGFRWDDDRLARLRGVALETGRLDARHPLFPPARCAEALADARHFFALPDEEKRRLGIEQSPHFRGYSVMHNACDWREQIHFGREEPARGSRPDYARLCGPNLWPRDAAWRRRIVALMRDLERAGRDILSALAMSVGLRPGYFLPENEDPYVLLKLIHYRIPPDGEPRSGVAPHVDFSWITLLLQDGTGGLEICAPDGKWLPVPAKPGVLVVNAGEILEFATAGLYAATPHRVVSRGASRVSLPFFLNPALSRAVEAFPAEQLSDQATPGGRPHTAAHVHRVFSNPRRDPFVFGDEEWRRKGLGIFCASCFEGV
jgi:isopenicillin N synthase-like dioxygenase